MAKKTKPVIEDLLNDLVKDSIKLVLGFLLSTGLIGGASYILFNMQPEVDEINRIILEINRQDGEAKFASEMVDVYASGFMSEKDKQDEIFLIVNQLVDFKFKKKLDLAFISSTTKILTDNSLQLTKEKGKISSYTIYDELLKDRQLNLLNWYNNELKLYDETYPLIMNWERETTDDRDERFLRIFDLMESSIGLLDTLITQTDQVIYHIENVRMVEMSQLKTELQSKQSRLNSKRILSWLGIIVGLSLIGSMAVYIKKQYFKQTNRKPRQKAG